MNEDSARAAKAYKDKVTSLTSERADLRARIQSLTEDVVKHKSDLRHASTTKARAEDKEKKAREGLRVAEGELRVVREELQIAKDELRNKVALLDRARREASEAESSIECLTEECNALRRDLQRQGALVTERDEAIAVLRDEACTSWASEWLAFQFRVARAFPSLVLNFQVPSEEELEESSFESEADPETFSYTPRSADCPGDPEVPAEASSPSLHLGALSSVQSPASDV